MLPVSCDTGSSFLMGYVNKRNIFIQNSNKKAILKNKMFLYMWVEVL